jgi:hypothetical protein
MLSLVPELVLGLQRGFSSIGPSLFIKLDLPIFVTRSIFMFCMTVAWIHSSLFLTIFSCNQRERIIRCLFQYGKDDGGSAEG